MERERAEAEKREADRCKTPEQFKNSLHAYADMLGRMMIDLMGARDGFAMSGPDWQKVLKIREELVHPMNNAAIVTDRTSAPARERPRGVVRLHPFSYRSDVEISGF
jgi:hypothetical protein